MVTWVVRAPERELRGGEKKLYTQARQALWDYEPLRASHAQILVEVQGHEVTLRGRVRTLPQKTMAELLVRRLPGVNDLTSELVADPEVVRAVADALAADARTAAYVIRVDARHGLTILVGEVPSEEVRQAALEVTSQVPLVLAVRNELTVGGRAYPRVALAPAPSVQPAAAVSSRSPLP